MTKYTEFLDRKIKVLIRVETLALHEVRYHPSHNFKTLLVHFIFLMK